MWDGQLGQWLLDPKVGCSEAATAKLLQQSNAQPSPPPPSLPQKRNASNNYNKSYNREMRSAPSNSAAAADDKEKNETRSKYSYKKMSTCVDNADCESSTSPVAGAMTRSSQCLKRCYDEMVSKNDTNNSKIKNSEDPDVVPQASSKGVPQQRATSPSAAKEATSVMSFPKNGLPNFLGITPSHLQKQMP